MAENNPAETGFGIQSGLSETGFDIQSGLSETGLSNQPGPSDAGPPVLYRQISYEELEECVFIVRDSISEFYLAPQGEISFAAVDAALKGDMAPEPTGGGDQHRSSGAEPHKTPLYNTGAHTILHNNAGSNAKPQHGAGAQGWHIGHPAVYNGHKIPNNISGTHKGIEVFSVEGFDEPLSTGGIKHPEADAVIPDGSLGINSADEGGGEVQDALTGVRGISPGRLKLPEANAAPIRQIYREGIKKRAKKRKTAIIRYVAACFSGAVFGGLLMLLCITVIFPHFNVSFFPPDPRNVHEVVYSYEYTKSDTQIEAIYDKVSPSVVGIRATSAYNEFIFGRQQFTGDGSGIIIHSDGYILTSNHVVASYATAYSQTQPDGGPPGGRRDAKLEVITHQAPETVYQARLIARDVKSNLALIKIDAVNLPVAELGDSDQLRAGEMVLAIGRPEGMNNLCSVTDGIVSGFNGGEASLIQTNAMINPGNNGGALVNSKGQIIGINVITSESVIGGGLGFAIPINSALAVAENLLDFNYVRGRVKTGISYSEAFNDNYEYYASQYPDIPKGVYVEYVEPLSGAFKAGVRAGDIVTKFNGGTVSDYTDMLGIMDLLTPGEIVAVEVYRDGETLVMDLELSEETG